MTLYPGSVVSQEYADGADQGYADGYSDEGAYTHEVLTAARHDAGAAHTRNERAWWLGYLRGYRDAVRTEKRGRWGT